MGCSADGRHRARAAGIKLVKGCNRCYGNNRMVSRLRAGQLSNSLFPGRGKRFSLLHNPDESVAHPFSYSVGTGDFSFPDKTAGSAADCVCCSG
jgi:hypothetical protein